MEKRNGVSVKNGGLQLMMRVFLKMCGQKYIIKFFMLIIWVQPETNKAEHRTKVAQGQPDVSKIKVCGSCTESKENGLIK